MMADTLSAEGSERSYVRAAQWPELGRGGRCCTARPPTTRRACERRGGGSGWRPSVRRCGPPLPPGTVDLQGSLAGSLPCSGDLQVCASGAWQRWSGVLHRRPPACSTVQGGPCSPRARQLLPVTRSRGRWQVEAGLTFSPLMARYTGNGASGKCLVTQARALSPPPSARPPPATICFPAPACPATSSVPRPHRVHGSSMTGPSPGDGRW